VDRHVKVRRLVRTTDGGSSWTLVQVVADRGAIVFRTPWSPDATADS